MSYTPLHVHSEYSLLDGLSKTSQISSRIKEIGSTACALTDHGSVSGAVDFSVTLSKAKQKSILGCEFYVSQGDAKDKHKDNAKLNHQVILAKNADGWRDILKLISQSNSTDRFYYKPRIDLNDIANVAGNGNLISFSGHLGSVLAKEIVTDDKLDPDWRMKGCNLAKALEQIFGKGNFFIEIQLIDSLANPLAKEVGEALRQVAIDTNIPCVATPDAHYARREDAEDQRVLLCTALRKSISQVQRDIKQGKNNLGCFFKSDNYHIPSYEEMKQFHTDEELENTNLIASMCDEYSIVGPPNPPEFQAPNNMDAEEYLRSLCRQGWAEKMAHVNKDDPKFADYGARVNEELEVFISTNLSSYFLIVADLLKFCRDRGYLTGPGRGSAAGCIVSYLLGITQIDPVPYNLVFERFYNAGRNTEGRISMPDIDIDIPKEARPEVIEYIRNKYGADNVAQIVTYQTLKGRAALKRVMGAIGNIPFEIQNAMTENIMDEARIADELQEMKEQRGSSSIIQWSIEDNPQKFEDWCEVKEDGTLEGEYAHVFTQAIRLEGTKIIQSKHAAGVVVSPEPISNVCPMVRSSDESDSGLVAGFEGPSCEEVGLLKLDVLGIRMLDKVMDVSKILLGV